MGFEHGCPSHAAAHESPAQVLVDLMPSSGPHGHCVFAVHVDTCRQNNIHINPILKKM